MKTKICYLFVIFLLFFWQITHSNADNIQHDCHITAHEVALDNGVVYYNRAGIGSPLLLLHGLFASKEQWDEVVCRLAVSGYTVIAPDLPGYGKSVDFPISDYQLEHQVVRLHQFMESLGITRFDVAGNSMGGTIAALYVQHYPQEISTLAFIGSPLGIIEWSPSVKEAIYQGINPFIPVDTAQLDLEMNLLFVNPPILPETVKEVLIKDYVERNRHYQQVWNIVSLYTTVLYPRPKFTVPTLILWGEADQIFAMTGIDALRYRFPRGKRVRLPHAGHLPQVENAEATATIYFDFLRTYSARRF